MKWYRIHPDFYARRPDGDERLEFTQIYAPAPLAPRFVRVLEDPGTLPVLSEVLTGVHHFDLGGVMMADRHEYPLLVDGLDLRVPATDFAHVYEALREREPEYVGGARFYGMNGWLRNVALLPAQRDFVLSQMQRLLPEALATASIENAEFNRRMVDARPPNTALRRRPVGKIEE
jgi:hypothetical protein